jgi:ABC-type multidrug transport system ATPase subunit
MLACQLELGLKFTFVILLAGVNGAGKTTTIGKLETRPSRVAGALGAARRRRHLPRRRASSSPPGARATT